MALESSGPDAARPYVDRAQPTHPSLIDEAHLVDELFGVVNIPNSVWIDESGTIVRPVEAAWPPAEEDGEQIRPDPPQGAAGERIVEMMTEAGKIVSDRDEYVAALRDGGVRRVALSSRAPAWCTRWRGWPTRSRTAGR